MRFGVQGTGTGQRLHRSDPARSQKTAQGDASSPCARFTSRTDDVAPPIAAPTVARARTMLQVPIVVHLHLWAQRAELRSAVRCSTWRAAEKWQAGRLR